MDFIDKTSSSSVTQTDKNTPKPVKIAWDGYYPYCPTCGHYDLDKNGLDKERCHVCNQLLDWENLE